MGKVCLGDVALEHKETCKCCKDGYPIVGLEHPIPEEITLTAWDEGSANTFTKMFRKGNVLFGRRRAYLKKAAVAPFDGICSGDITVIEAKTDRLLPELLPFVIQNDALFNFAVGKSAGSLSPRVKWEHLKNFEFELPDMNKQKELAALLWAMDDTKKSYQKLISATDELVKSQFIEMFGEPVANTKQLPVHQLTEYIEFLTSGSRGWAKYHSDAGEWFITIKNVKNCKVSVEEIQHITPPQNAEAERSRVHEGDLLISITADSGRTGVVTKEIAEHGAYINQHLTCIRLNKQALNPTYVAYFMESTAGKRQFFAKNLSSVKAGLNFDSIRTLKLMVPPLPLQQEFVEFLTQSDKSKYHIQKSMTKCSEAVYEVRSILYPKCYLNRAKME